MVLLDLISVFVVSALSRTLPRGYSIIISFRTDGVNEKITLVNMSIV